MRKLIQTIGILQITYDVRLEIYELIIYIESYMKEYEELSVSLQDICVLRAHHQ